MGSCSKKTAKIDRDVCWMLSTPSHIRLIMRCSSLMFLILITLSLPKTVLSLEAIAEVNEPGWAAGDSGKDKFNVNDHNRDKAHWPFNDPEYSQYSITDFFAPLPVFFEGWRSSPRDEIVQWEWDFGDGSPKFYGFNAAHVYEEPGTYQARLKVTDMHGNSALSEHIEIHVQERDGKTYYVDSQVGDDSYDGLCMTPDGSGCGPWKTATRAFKCLNGIPEPK
mgnify:CR=1 FL=1